MSLIGEAERAGIDQHGDVEIQRGFINLLLGGKQEQQPDYSLVMSVGNAEGNGQRLHLHTREYVFTVRVVKHWNWFLREIIVSLSNEIFKTELEMVIDNFVQLAPSEQGLN